MVLDFYYMEILVLLMLLQINIFVVVTIDGRILFFCRGSVIQTFAGFTCFKDRIRCTITPCGTYIISGSEDCNAYAWNITSG